MKDIDNSVGNNETKSSAYTVLSYDIVVSHPPTPPPPPSHFQVSMLMLIIALWVRAVIISISQMKTQRLGEVRVPPPGLRARKKLPLSLGLLSPRSYHSC